MEPQYPLKLVAMIAAQLLTEEEYEVAVRKARNIITEAWTQEENAKRAREEERRQHAKAERELDMKTVPYAKAIREITRQDNETDATKCFRELLQKQFEPGPTWLAERGGLSTENVAKIRAELAERVIVEIASWKKRGFSRIEVMYFRELYLRKFPRRRPKPRKKSFG
jgi:hypothetical protein